MSGIEGARVLVIGGAGFIGSWVVRLLVEEPVDQIVIFDNFTRGRLANIAEALKDPRVEVFQEGGEILHTDILRRAMEGMDYVIHLAALWLLHCQEYPRAAFKVNVEGSFNVMEAAVELGVKRVVFSSSASVYGNALRVPMDEDHPLNNTTFYGATKIAVEQMLTAFHHRYGLEFVGLRYMNVYGPGQDYRGAYVAVLMHWLRAITEGRPIVIHGDGTQTYDFVYVEDVARANVLALTRGKPGAFYNVGSGVGTSLNELAKLLLKVAGAESLGIRYESPSRAVAVTKRIGDPTRAKQELGFEAKVGLEEGLKKLMEWFRREQQE